MTAPTSGAESMPYFPKADAKILLSCGPTPSRPKTVGPIFDPQNVDLPIKSWSAETEASCYPPKDEPYAPSEIPPRPSGWSDKYLRPSLAKNERLRLSMLWYHTRDILHDTEFLSGLQEKACFAQESTGWEFAVIGIQDVNFYIRLASVGLQLGIIPRGEAICAHTVTQPPSSMFLIPDLMEDWRFQETPYLEVGGVRGYAGVPLRLQHESGECANLGSLCVASSTREEALTKSQQMTLVRLADWIVTDIFKCARARRQRERQRMTELIAMVQDEIDDAVSEQPILRTLRAMYPDADISLQSSRGTHIEMEGRDPIPLSQIESGLWEDTEYIDDFIEKSNNQEFPFTRAVRAIAAQCENVSGPSLLVVATKNFQLVFDDIDSWFVQTCADIVSKRWHKHILAEVVETKEKFLRGFSHQLRTPLHGIIGSVEMLAEELGVNDLRSNFYASTLLGSKLPIDSRGPIAHLEIIRTAGRDLVSIVNSMITLNRWADIAMRDRHHSIHTTLELEKSLANEIMKIFSGDTRYTASIFFNHRLPSDCDTIRIDLELLRDSLLPLVINAIQNTPGGIVTITISLIPETKQLIVDIEDNGRGIHPDHHSRIFDPYERAGVHSTGAGLGLTLSAKFAALLHGSIALVYSHLNNGSHFKATFHQVEHLMLPSPSQPLASKLNTLPSKFYNMTFDWDTPSLSNIVAKYLTYNKFVNSTSMNDCFAILDFVPDGEQRRASLSQFPSDQVILCFIPSSVNFKCLEDTPNNVIYVRGPFLTSTMVSALEEADELVSSLKPSIECHMRPYESTLTLQEVENNPEPDQRQISPTGGSSSQTVWSRQLPTGSPITSNPDISVLSNYRTERKTSIDSAPIIPPSSSLTNSPRPTSLLVDDNDINLRILQMYCNKRGLPYCCATDGFEAVKAFSCYQSSPVAVGRAAIQLVIMDLQMPGCDGIEATRQIRLLEKQNKWKECVVFIVTGQDSPADRKAAESAGADEYLVKPVGIKLLDRSVKQYFDAFQVS